MNSCSLFAHFGLSLFSFFMLEVLSKYMVSLAAYSHLEWDTKKLSQGRASQWAVRRPWSFPWAGNPDISICMFLLGQSRFSSKRILQSPALGNEGVGDFGLLDLGWVRWLELSSFSNPTIWSRALHSFLLYLWYPQVQSLSGLVSLVSVAEGGFIAWLLRVEMGTWSHLIVPHTNFQ